MWLTFATVQIAPHVASKRFEETTGRIEALVHKHGGMMHVAALPGAYLTKYKHKLRHAASSFGRGGEKLSVLLHDMSHSSSMRLRHTARIGMVVTLEMDLRKPGSRPASVETPRCARFDSN